MTAISFLRQPPPLAPPQRGPGWAELQCTTTLPSCPPVPDMIISHTAEYSLRAMAILSGAYTSGQRLRSKELAEQAYVPEHYLSKVMRRLVVAGLVEGLRGHGGGFRLARAPHEIRFSDVLDAVQWSPDDQRCAFGFGNCDPSRPCALHPAWVRLNRAVVTWAHDTTLAEVMSLEHLQERLAEQTAQHGPPPHHGHVAQQTHATQHAQLEQEPGVET